MSFVQGPFNSPRTDLDEMLHESIFEIARQFPDKPALIDNSNGTIYSYRKLAELTVKIGWNLQSSPVKLAKGDVVLSLLDNIPEYIPILLGVTSAGGILSPLNPQYTESELSYYLNDNQASIVIVGASFLSNALKAINGLAHSKVRTVFVHGAPPQVGTFPDPRCVRFEKLYSGPQVFDERNRPVSSNVNPAKDACILLYSSGTTGRPKGVLISHSALLATIKPDPSGLGTSLPGRRDTNINVLPMFHMAGVFCIGPSLYSGGTCVMMPKYDVVEFAKAIERNSVTAVFAVPLILLNLVKDARIQSADFSSVNQINYGSAPAGEELLSAVLGRFPNVQRFVACYGMTESGIQVCSPPIDPRRLPLKSCGVPHSGCQIKIVSIDGTNRTLGAEEQGEIWIRGPGTMLKYLNKPEQTAAVLDSQGWIHSGDVGYFDAAGYLYVCDRIKELIKYKSFQVAPAEIEDLLLKHPAVQDCVVVGIRQGGDEAEAVGELVTAFVALKNTEMSKDQVRSDLIKSTKEHLTNYKHIRGGIHFMDSIPRGDTGKLNRRVLREMAQERFDTEKDAKSKL